MTPEAARHLGKARELLAQAAQAVAVDLAEIGGRTAYLAGFHAAQALIFERSGKVAKTHSGVHAKFAELIEKEATIGKEERAFLGRAYNLKALADYDTSLGSRVGEVEARETLQKAEHFVECVARLLGE